MPTPISVATISRGPLGALQTLQRMRSVVNRSLVDPLVIETARRVVAEVPARDTDAQALAVRGFLAEHVQFVQDPRGVEMLATPTYLLTQIARRYVAQGDCDDAAILGAALAKAVGLKARLVVLAFQAPTAPFTHVYTVVKGRTRWIDLDTTRSANRRVEPEISRVYSVEV